MLSVLFRETHEHWHIFIEDAILEKCNEKGADIVHIAVDQSSNEVSRALTLLYYFLPFTILEK